MRNLARAAAAAVVLVFTLPVPGHSAIVGTLSTEAPTITVPLAFNAKADVFNSFTDVPGGLTFAIAPGSTAPVRLEVLEGSGNIKVVAAAIDSAFGISQTLPLALTTLAALSPGVHGFAIGAVTAGQSQGALIARLTLTPLPSALLLLGSAGAVLGAWNFARKRPEQPQGPLTGVPVAPAQAA